MAIFEISILVLALVLFTVLAFNRVGALTLATVVSLITIVLARLPILDTLLGPFMVASTAYVKNYFFIFFLGAIFSALYEDSKAAKSIALVLSNATGGKYLAALIFTVTMILTYGGISGFVIYFVMYPITLQLFQKNNISRILIPAAITAGCWTVSMIAPGSPSVQNVIAMKSLGTDATAALLPGIAACIVQYIAIVVWFEYRTKQLCKQGRGFVDDTLPPLPANELNFEDSSNEKRPGVLISFIPIIIILSLFNIVRLPVETSVFFGILAAVILFFPYFTGGKDGFIGMLNRGGVNASNALLNTAIIVGFGGVAKMTQGFEIVTKGILDLNMSPLIFVAISVAVCAGMCGSASGGMGIAFDALKDTFISLGINLEYVHRIAAIAAGTLDSLPHQGGQITIFAITHMDHKNSYFDIFITQLLIPLLSLLIVIPMCAMGL